MRKWFKRMSPDRDRMLANRWLRPLAHRLTHPQIWQFNRRNVARGVALGLFMGFVLPAGQIVGAAVMAASIRGNLLVAAAMTFVTNPFTTLPIYYAAYRTGSFLLSPFLGASNTASQMSPNTAVFTLETLTSGSLATVFGLLLFATVSSATGFAAVHLGWRLSLLLQWRRRLRRSV